MSKITYADKVTLNENPNVADVNKVKASDLNEIKNVVNANYDDVGDVADLNTQDKSSTVNAINEINDKFNYSTEEQIIGTWINGKPIYRKTFVVSITGHFIIVGNIPNLDIITSCNSYLHRDGSEYHNINNWGQNDQDFGTTYRYGNNIEFNSSYKGTLYITLEYTKTTD